jgi:Lantibiotic biosynthesis dehydratase C-term
MLDGQDWISVHAFNHLQTETLVAAVVSPLLRHWKQEERLRAGFYLCHWEGGPHVRVRLLSRATHDRAALENELTIALETHLSTQSRQPLDPAQYARYAEQERAFEGAPEPVALQADGAVRPWLYVPEWDRFGGARLAPSVVQVFSCSSLLAGQVREAGWPAQRRVSLAWQGAVLTLSQATGSPQRLLWALTVAARFWSSALGSAQTVFEEWMTRKCSARGDALQIWMAAALDGRASVHEDARTLSTEILQHLRCLRSPESDESVLMALDLLHLHHNRLGFTAWQEAQLWLSLQLAAQHVTQGARHAS